MSPYLLSSQGDRVAMAHGVEVRYPFLDPEVVAFAAGLPPRLKLSGLRDKRVLRALANRYIPRSIAERAKQPYRAPMTGPFFGPDAPEYVRELLAVEALDGRPDRDPSGPDAGREGLVAAGDHGRRARGDGPDWHPDGADPHPWAGP